jgi:hypothetical protein
MLEVKKKNGQEKSCDTRGEEIRIYHFEDGTYQSWKINNE